MAPIGFTRVDKRGLLEHNHMETIEQKKWETVADYERLSETWTGEPNHHHTWKEGTKKKKGYVKNGDNEEK